MTLISKLKSLLGVNAGRSNPGGTTVTVEREPRTESERAVKDPAGPTATEVAEESTDTTADATGAIEEAEPAQPDSADSDEPVENLSGIGPAYAAQLAEAGIESVSDLAAADAAELASATDIGEGRLAGWIEQAKAA